MVQHGTEPSLRTKMTLFVAIWGHIFLFFFYQNRVVECLLAPADHFLISLPLFFTVYLFSFAILCNPHATSNVEKRNPLTSVQKRNGPSFFNKKRQ
jgi:hypothetical protein